MNSEVRTVQARSEAAASNGGLCLPPELTAAVGYALRVAQETSFSAYLARAGHADLKPGRYSVLMLIAANPGLTPTALARAMGRDKSTLTATLRGLEASGLSARTRDTQDRRSYGIALTEAGHHLLRELRRHASAHDAVLDGIVGPDKPLFMAVLARIIGALAVDPGRTPSPSSATTG